MADRQEYEEVDACGMEWAECVSDPRDGGGKVVYSDTFKEEERAYARGTGDYLQRGADVSQEGFESVLKWLGEVEKDVHRLAELEFPKLRYYPLATKEEYSLRQFYRGLLSQVCLRASRPEGVESHQIASCVARSLVDYLFQDVRVRDRPYVGVRSRLEDWKFANEIDSKGRSTARGDRRVAKLFTRLEKLVKDGPVEDREKSEVRSVADLVDPDTGKTFMFDLKTGEVLK